MDIALCTVDFETFKLEFAGAFNPLFIVRNGELIQVKPDKVPIGAFIDDELHQFTNNSFDLQPGDMIYVFSDGYVDQFGGEQNKKFMISRFRELLVSISGDPLDKQKEHLLKTHNEWRGENEQVDDILVIGVRVK